MIVDSLGITLLLGIFCVLVLLRVPITFCLAISAIITGIYLNVPLEAIVKTMADGVMNFSPLGSIVIPMMKKQGYDEDFSVGLTFCSACQGIIIPPSHNMIIYAFAVGTASQLAGGSMLVVSVGKLFLGGYLPGILMGIMMLLISLVIAIRRKYPR